MDRTCRLPVGEHVNSLNLWRVKLLGIYCGLLGLTAATSQKS